MHHELLQVVERMKITVSSLRSNCRELRWRGSPAVLGFFLVVSAAPMTISASAQIPSTDYAAVPAKPYAPTLVAYGQVQPVTVVPVAAAETGVIVGLRVRPGSHVRAGEVVAHLRGPAISSLLLQSQADLRSAQAQLDAAEKALGIEQQQLPAHLTTRQAVHQAESAATQARSGVDNAQSRLNSVQQMMTITAPSDGTVLTLGSADGALVSPGQTVLTLQPAGGLWLQVMYYGADLARIRVGMGGSFAPSDGSGAIAVRVVSIPGTVTSGGGESIALASTDAHSCWLSGEAGTVTLKLPARQMVEVPTRALIVNQGKWWVLVYTAKGNRPQQVVPGPADGWNTWIESGLTPGTEIVVNNAYLLFHSGIAEQYQIPD